MYPTWGLYKAELTGGRVTVSSASVRQQSCVLDKLFPTSKLTAPTDPFNFMNGKEIRKFNSLNYSYIFSNSYILKTKFSIF